MRKTINIFALLFLIWMVFDTFNVQSVLLNFLLVGEIPGATTNLSPSMMLAIMTAIGGIFVFEMLARRIEIMWRVRQHITKFIDRRERLPRRRYSRI
jgi:hypothetical protein